MDKQLKTKSLQQLIKQQTQMTKDIRQLDSGMKTLVYENYNKFISATDTIRQMKRNVGEMEEEMKRLESNMKNITRCTEAISSSLAPNRQMIEKLSGVSNLLQKRQFLFELPSRLNLCIERGAYAQAVRYYNGCRYILDKYDNLPSFKAISIDSEEIIEKMKSIIREQLEAPNVQARQFASNLEYLLDLNEESGPLREQFVAWAVADVRRQLEAFGERKLPDLEKVAAAEKSAKMGQKEGEEDAGEAEGEIEKDEDERQRQQLFGGAKKESKPLEEPESLVGLSAAEKVTKATLIYLSNLNSGFVRELIQFLDAYFRLFVEREQDQHAADRAEAEFDVYAHELFSMYSSIVQERILAVTDVPGIIRCLELVSKAFDGTTAASRVDLKAHVETTISGAIRAYMQVHFDQCCAKITDKVSSLAEYGRGEDDDEGGPAPNILCGEVSSVISNAVVHFILKCKPFFEIHTKHFLVEHSFNGYSSLKAFVEQAAEVVMDLADNYRLELAASATKKASASERRKLANPTFVLLLSRVCLAMSETAITDVEKAIRKVESLVRFVTPNSRLHLLRTFETEPLVQQLGDSAQKLVSSYVRYQGTRVSQMVRTGVDTPDWLKAKEPREVRLVINMVLSEIQAMSEQIALVFDSKERSGARTGRGGSYSASEQSIKKIFEQKVQIFGGKLEYNVESVVTGITKIVLKSFAESVRLRTFNKYGFQQMQVDTQFFRTVLDVVDDTKLIAGMLDDIIGSATSRCVDPVPMEPLIVKSICDRNTAAA